MNDRDFLSIRGRAVRHTTAARDWVCGECGSRLATRWFEAAPNWRTVCANDPGHDQDQFITSSAWVYREHNAMMEDAQARKVFDHLPAELRAAITGKGE